MAQKANSEHPDFGQWDRFLFNKDGLLCPKAYFNDPLGTMIKLGNRCVDIDHMATRLDIISKDDPKDKVEYPTCRVFDGELDIFGYSIFVSEVGKIPTKYVFITRPLEKEVQYFGGLSTNVTDDKGYWHGLQFRHFNGWLNWVKEIFETDPGAYMDLQPWLNRCRTSATMRFGKSLTDIFAEAKRTNLAVVNGPDTPKDITPEISKEEPEGALPVPLEGKVGDIEKVNGQLVKVA